MEVRKYRLITTDKVSGQYFKRGLAGLAKVEYDSTIRNYRMNQEEVITILKGHSEYLQSMGVHSLALFGSVARNEAGPHSDVDLLIEIKHPMGLFGLFRIQQYIEQLLGGIKVDLVMKESVLEDLKDDILEDSVLVI
jgi:predicted nucleotidyltransferase